MAATNYYVDPNAGSDSTGDGSSGNPWKSVQKALNTITRNATGGDQINVKAGTADVLASALTLATYGTPAAAGPLWFRGYTSTANDGGIGDISGNASVGIIAESKTHIYAADMHLHNCGAANIWDISGSQTGIWHCELDTTTGRGVNFAGNDTNLAATCYVHDIGGAYGSKAGVLLFNRFESLGKTVTTALTPGVLGHDNTVAVASTSNGMSVETSGVLCLNNSIWANAGTGKGITLVALAAVVSNNIVEGFSGTGGKSINDAGNLIQLYGPNFTYNNAGSGATGIKVLTLANDVALSGSPFTNPSGAPADLSLNNIAGAGASCRSAGYPTQFYGNPFTNYRDAGAVQHQDSPSQYFVIEC